MCWLSQLQVDFAFILLACESHLPKSYLRDPRTQDETWHLLSWMLKQIRPRLLKRSQPWVEFGTWSKSCNCPAFKIRCKHLSLVLAVEPGLPQGLNCNAACMEFSRSAFKNLCHNCICKEVLGINSWLADVFTQWSLYQALGIYRQSRSVLYLA